MRLEMLQGPVHHQPTGLADGEWLRWRGENGRQERMEGVRYERQT
jgi:hypothetical protein